MFEALKWKENEDEDKRVKEIVQTNQSIQKLVESGALKKDELTVNMSAETVSASRAEIGNEAISALDTEMKQKTNPYQAKMVRNALRLGDIESELSKSGLLPSEKEELESEKKQIEREEIALVNEETKIKQKYHQN